MTPGENRPRVLVIRGGAIGDFILTLPAIRLLREHIPHAHLEVLGYQPIIDLALKAGLADATRSLEHGTMAKLFVPHASLDEELVRYLKGFNLVVSYLYDPDGHLRGNMERLAVKTYLEASHRVGEGLGHATEQLALPLQRLAMFLDESSEATFFTSTPQDTSAELPLIAIHPGSGSLRKNWALENWISLGRDLTGSRLALITGEAEHERGITAQIVAAWQGLDYMHWDQLALPDLAERLGACAAFLGHDSGISHLAAACGVPCFLLFGPTDPATWAPRGAEVLVEPTRDLTELSPQLVRARLGEFLSRITEKTKVSGL
jgi:heptosyltransferase III